MGTCPRCDCEMVTDECQVCKDVDGICPKCKHEIGENESCFLCKALVQHSNKMEAKEVAARVASEEVQEAHDGLKGIFGPWLGSLIFKWCRK